MITSFLTRIASATERLFAALVATIAGLVAAPAPALAVVRTRRGAGFLEWALLAALALGIAAILWRVFPDAFEGLLDRIRDGIDRS